MITKEEISIAATSVLDAKYDEAAKEGLHHPKLIAPILKATIDEYKDYSCDEIVQFIVKDSIVDDPIDDVSIIANQLTTENGSISEKLIRYDSRFKAINPKLSNKSINFYLHIDLEVQNDYKPSNPKYPIIKRGIYYGAREISSQLGIITNETNYDKLEKVYSIWICNERVPKKLQNTVTSYTITKNDIIGASDEPEKNYDLMTVIIIRRGEKDSEEDIFDYLNSYFNSDVDGICKYVDIRGDDDALKGVENMTGLGESIYNRGIAKGIEKGIEKGVARGVEKGIIEGIERTLRNVMNTFGLTFDEACERIALEDREKYRKLFEV